MDRPERIIPLVGHAPACAQRAVKGSHLLPAILEIHHNVLLLSGAMKGQEADGRKEGPDPSGAQNQGASSLVIPDCCALALLDCALADPQALAVGAVAKRLILAAVVAPQTHSCLQGLQLSCSSSSYKMAMHKQSRNVRLLIGANMSMCAY